MRNRPDSRHRLAGLRPAQVATDRLIASTADIGGWIPGDDADLFGWSEVDRGGRAGDAGDGGDVVDVGNGGDALDAEVARSPGPVAVAHRAGRERLRRHDRWGRLAQRWVPESLRDSRIDPGKRGALLLTVVAAVAALVAAVGVWRDRPEPRPVQSVSLAQVTDTAVPGTARKSTGLAGAGRSTGSVQPLSSVAADGGGSNSSATTSAPGVIVVSVTGAVRRPGLVRLAAGSRVAEAIDMAGGAVPKADLTGLNLAAKLSDGASVVVSGGSGQRSSVSSSGGESRGVSAGATTTSGRPADKLDLNTADAIALDALPGVGPVTAANIVAWREKNGSYTSVEQLQEIAGIGPAKYGALAELVTVQ